jgi:hypothetical protein
MADEDDDDEPYNFSDFEIGPEIENQVRNLLRDAFAAFKKDGKWISYGSSRLYWVVRGDSPFWGGEFPVLMSLSAAQLKDAFCSAIECEFRSRKAIEVALSQWEEACAAIRREIEKMRE